MKNIGILLPCWVHHVTIYPDSIISSNFTAIIKRLCSNVLKVFCFLRIMHFLVAIHITSRQIKFQLDKYDRIILNILQKGCTRSIGNIAEKVGLSNMVCWRRIYKIEEKGIIRAKVALLDSKKLIINVIVMVFIKTAQRNVEWIQKIHHHINAIEEVIKMYHMADETDYLPKVAESDITEYDKVYKN